MRIKKVLPSPWFWLLVGICGLLTWVGYDRLFPLKYYPVEGTVMVDGEPFIPELPLDDHRTGYMVHFTPISAGRDRYSSRCRGELDRKGRYRLVTEITTSLPRQGPHAQRLDTFAGAASGWYEVTITHLLEDMPGGGGDLKGYHLRKKLGLKRRTTPYRIKVVEHPEPGHYDIKLETYLGKGKAQEEVKK